MQKVFPFTTEIFLFRHQFPHYSKHKNRQLRFMPLCITKKMSTCYLPTSLFFVLWKVFQTLLTQPKCKFQKRLSSGFCKYYSKRAVYVYIPIRFGTP